MMKLSFWAIFFDDFGDDPELIGEMCGWLEYSVNQPNRIHLFGNHDVHYARSERHFHCSGYADWKYFIIHDNFKGKKVWDRFKWYHILDGKWLLTHAGLHKSNLPTDVQKLHKNRPVFLKEVSDYLDAEIIHGYRNNSWIFHAGRSRGGSQNVGGISWCDFEREFHPAKGLNQVFGHTPQGMGHAKWCYMDKKGKVSYHPTTSKWCPKSNDIDNVNISYNICLDVYKNFHWAMWDGKMMTVFNELEDLQ